MAAPLYLCLHVPDFGAQALVRLRPELRNRPIAILDGEPPLETVFSLNQRAWALGLDLGMRRLQAESFAGISVSSRVSRQEDSAFLILMQCAQRYSPRIEPLASPAQNSSAATLVLDISGSERLLGSPAQIAATLRRDVEAAGLEPRVAACCNANAAVLTARGLPEITIIQPGHESAILSPLPLSVLHLESEQEETFASWGIHTLGALAALPQKALIARIGQPGYQLQALARGDSPHLLTPEARPIDAALCESTELEHPVDLLEPLLFLLSRMLEQIFARASEHALAIACIETRLVLEGTPSKEHRRVIRPALPEQNHHTLLKLIQLDLEMHPPQAAVIALHMQAQSARPQTVQQGLFAPQTPEAGRLEILLARLRKLLGQDRVGAPVLLDNHRPDSFQMTPFLPGTNTAMPEPCSGSRSPALRILRPPRLVRVEMQSARIAALLLDGQKFRVSQASGPWKTSGAWWTHSQWCREEWDVALGVPKGSAPPQEAFCCRLAYDPNARCWYLTGIYD